MGLGRRTVEEYAVIPFDRVVWTTPEAWLLNLGGEKVWLPKSQCELMEEEQEIWVPQWLAEKKGLGGCWGKRSARASETPASGSGCETGTPGSRALSMTSCEQSGRSRPCCSGSTPRGTSWVAMSGGFWTRPRYPF